MKKYLVAALAALTISFFPFHAFSGTYGGYVDIPVTSGGGGGVTSINGNTTAAQIITGGTGISVSSTGGTTTITNTEPAGSTGNLTDSGTDGITVTGGTGAVNGSGTSLSQHVADTSHNGYLLDTDWNTFNGKQAALTFTAPLVDTTNTVTCNVASGSQPGCLASADWTTFNGKLTSTLTSGDIFVGNGSNVATGVALSGDATLANTGAMTLATVNSNVGSFTSANITVNAKGLITAAANGSGGGSGTVTSVAFADASGTPIYTISGSPVTTSGTLTETLATQSANLVFAGPTSSTAQPTFRSLVAGDIPPVTNLAGGGANSIPYQSGANATTFLSQGTGVLQELAGAPAFTQTPRLSVIEDTGGNPAATITATGSAVNGFVLTDEATGTSPILSPGGSGSDSNLDLVLKSKGTNQVRVSSGFVETPVTLTISGSAFTVDCSLGNFFSVTLNGATITASTVSNCVDGQKITVAVIQAAGGGDVVSWNSTYWNAGSVLAFPTQTTTANALDYYGFIYRSSTSKLNLVAYTQGF